MSNKFAKLIPETFSTDIMPDPTPRQLHEAYRLGSINGVWNPKTSPYPYNRFAGYQADEIKANKADGLFLEDSAVYGKFKGLGTGKRINGHHAWTVLDPEKGGSGRQVTGDCVSWGTRGAIDRMRCNRILEGRLESYVLRGATCGYYAGRRHNGEGAVSSWISAYALEIGVILEQEYDAGGQHYDFRNYEQYVKWGMSHGTTGVPDALKALTRNMRPGGWHQIATTDAALDLLAAGGTIHIGSQLAVIDTGNPISKRSGSWAHDMDVPFVDDTREYLPYRVWGFDQSWGRWNSLSSVPEAWKPLLEGMFFISDTDMAWAIRNGECCGFVPGRFYGISTDIL